MLKNKVALVTGGGKGIGASIAKEMAREGALVIINYSYSEGAARQVEKEISEVGGQAEIVRCDVSDFEAVKEMIGDIVKKHGRIDILVNNAGITRDGLSLKMSEEDFESVLKINLTGAFNMTQAVLKPMTRARSGAIINISSVVGLMGNAGQANYAASKAGLIGLTKSIAREVAARNVRVNAVAPGFIESDMTEVLSDKVKDAMKGQIPMKRFGMPEEIATATQFLAEQEYMTGQVLTIDGGVSM